MKYSSITPYWCTCQLRWWSWPWHTQVSHNHNPLFNQDKLTTAKPSTWGVLDVFVWPGGQDAYCCGSRHGCGDGNKTNTHRKWKSDAKSATATSSSGWNWQTQGLMKYDMIWKSCGWNASITRFPWPESIFVSLSCHSSHLDYVQVD